MDELEISGKRFLSTRRAAKDHKYTSDYVGQLIRGGKVVGKKVGRSWYVEEQSLNAYLSGEQTQGVPVVKEQVVERLVIEELEATPVIAEVAEPKAEEEKGEKLETVVVKKIPEEKTFEPVIVKTKILEERHIPIRTTTLPTQEVPAIGLRYVADDEPALPEIKRKTAIPSSPQLSVSHAAQEDEEVEEYVEIIPSKKVGMFAIAGLVVAGLATLSITAAISANLNSRIVVEQGQVASVGYTFQ